MSNRDHGGIMQPHPITLEFIARAEITLGEISDVGQVPTGHRRVIPTTGGHLAGAASVGDL